VYTWTNISISNWKFLIPCYHQNSQEVVFKHILFQQNPLLNSLPSAWLLVDKKLNLDDISTMRLSLITSIIPYPFPLGLKIRSWTRFGLCTIHLLGRVNSKSKSAKTCALSAYRYSKVISNSEKSMDHLVILPAKFGLIRDYLSGWSVRTTIRCTKKYLLCFLEAIINSKEIFSIFWYRVLGPSSAFE